MHYMHNMHNMLAMCNIYNMHYMHNMHNMLDMCNMYNMHYMHNMPGESLLILRISKGIVPVLPTGTSGNLPSMEDSGMTYKT